MKPEVGPLTLFETLAQSGVEYLVAGGTAVSYYGEYRASRLASGQWTDKPDLDCWYNPTYANYFRLLSALEALGRQVTRYRAETAPDPGTSFFRYEFADYTLDLLPRLCAPLRFADCAVRRHVVERAGVVIPLLSLADLIQDKQALGRPKDLADIANLRKHNPAADC